MMNAISHDYKQSIDEGMVKFKDHSSIKKSLREKGHIVAFDPFFSTIPLLGRLHEAGIKSLERSILEKPFSRFSLKVIWDKNKFVGRISGRIKREEGEEPTPRKAIFMRKDTKAFRIISNYHGSDLSEVQRKMRNGGFRNVTCRKAIAITDFPPGMRFFTVIDALKGESAPQYLPQVNISFRWFSPFLNAFQSLWEE